MIPRRCGSEKRIGIKRRIIMQFDEPTTPIEPIILMNNLLADPSEEQMPLNVAIVYQDAQTREWANQTCARVAQQVRTEPIRSSWWKLDCLEHPLLLQGAAHAAAHADVIIIALYGVETMPFELAHWLETWLEQRAPREGAFVALIGAVQPSDAGANATRKYLREVASRGHLKFIPQVRRMAIPADDRAPESAFAPFSASPRGGDVAFGRSRDFHDNWGINE